MGQILLIKGADFSANAVSLDNVYDTVKYTDAGSPSYPMTSGDSNIWFNTIAFTKKVKVYAVAITIPSDVSGFTKTTGNLVKVGSCNSSREEIGRVSTNVDNLIEKIVDGDIEAGSTVIVPLSTPYIINAGDYAWVGMTANGARFLCYARVPSGNYGYCQKLSSDTPTNYNLGVTFYGEELD